MKGITATQWALAGLAFLASLTAGFAWQQAQLLVPDASNAFGGSAAYDIFLNADHVEAFRIEEPNSWKSLEEFPVTNGPVVIPAASLPKLRSAIRSVKWDGLAKGCIPDYGVRIDFKKGRQRLSIFICFECTDMRALLNGKSPDWDRSNLMLLEFNEQEMADVIRPLFPNDPVIQRL